MLRYSGVNNDDEHWILIIIKTRQMRIIQRKPPKIL